MHCNQSVGSDCCSQHVDVAQVDWCNDSKILLIDQKPRCRGSGPEFSSRQTWIQSAHNSQDERSAENLLIVTRQTFEAMKFSQLLLIAALSTVFLSSASCYQTPVPQKIIPRVIQGTKQYKQHCCCVDVFAVQASSIH